MRFKVGFSVLAIIVLTYLLYTWISSLPKSANESLDSGPITVERGEQLFWGKGRCHVCHRIGERGYALRGPNLGASKDGPIIAVRAGTRARNLSLPSGTAYLTQSIVDPGAFIVPNYKNEMPKAHQAPIALSAFEMKALILYLQSLGETPDLEEIRLPSLSFENPEDGLRFITKGDVETGRYLFFDLQGPAACATCHIGINARGEPEGSTIGPDLRTVASYRTARHIFQKIVNPDSNVVSGYDLVMIRTHSDRIIVGKIIDELEDSIIIENENRERVMIPKNEIASRMIQSHAIMPTNYRELLTKKQLDDLLAYLLTLQGN
jgi:putative heme-binding domain-containing protein